MLHSMLLEGFRSFEKPPALRFAPLTFLVGPNNVGKSSVIQALLVFIQSEQAKSRGTLLLSGAWCDLGDFDRVVCAGLPAERRNFSIGLTGKNRLGQSVDALWSFGPPSDEPLASAPILSVEYMIGDAAGRVTRDHQEEFGWQEEITSEERHAERGGTAFFTHPTSVTPFERNVLSLGNPNEPRLRSSQELRLAPIEAARTNHVGPFRAPPQPLYTPRTSPIGPPIGRYGEHTAELLFRSRTQRTDLIPPGSAEKEEPQPIPSAVNAWWSYIFDGSLALQIDAPARLGFTLSIDTASAERLGLGQVGLGLSQALPIVAACLVSGAGDLILVETPEAHLHPGAQHRIANLFVELARRGRQVLVETHSEHIVNAARLAVKSGFPKDDISILFFDQEGGRTVVETIEIDPTGRALRFPKGFFDQAAVDLAELLR